MAAIKIPVSFMCEDIHRLLLRLFESFQICAHFVGVTARCRIADDEDQALVDSHSAAMRAAVDGAQAKLDEALDDAERLFKIYGIAPPRVLDAETIRMTVNVNSSLERRFLELICQLDQVTWVLQVLESHGISTGDPIAMLRARLKKQVRSVLKTPRQIAAQLRQRMTAKWAGGRSAVQ